MEGAGVYFKASLCGKIYKHFSFLVEEDIRPRDDFKEAEWFLTTVEVNYKFNKYLLAGSGYMSLARYKASDELRNRYYLYATGTYSAGRFTLSVRDFRMEGAFVRIIVFYKAPPRRSAPRR